MTVTTLGRVNVATPGTLVQLSTDPTQRVNKLLFQAVAGLTGKGEGASAGTSAVSTGRV